MSAQTYPAAQPKGNTSGAATSCPWLTEGSAAAALGGSVRVSLNIIDTTQGTCTFTRKDAAQAQLKVVVGTANVPACPSGSAAVAGIGTQANRCHLQAAHDAVTEMISAKIRTVNMAVNISGVPKAPSADSEYRPPVGIDEIAEQVAGNLF